MSLVTSSSPNLFVSGMIIQYGAASAPVGWLLCDGSAVSRTTYVVLFGIISTTYGTGDGSTTFNVPDFRGRSPIGSGTGSASGATAHSLGSTPTSGSGGEEKHTMTSSELVAHHHSISFSQGNNSSGSPGVLGTQAVATNTGDTGSTTPFNILHPITTVNFIIKT